ncbi:hypothetical protein, partial [Erwinia tracheiphila]|uniref:hypothetical protein n=1 Tax=Erwinia tracheiphila TaxID=65700 RepID=UPI001E480807
LRHDRKTGQISHQACPATEMLAADITASEIGHADILACRTTIFEKTPGGSVSIILSVNFQINDFCLA